MQEISNSSLESDIAELICLQKKQLVHERIRTGLSVLAIAALIVITAAVLRLVPEISSAITDIKGSIADIAEAIENLDLEALFEEGYENSAGSVFDFFDELFH